MLLENSEWSLIEINYKLKSIIIFNLAYFDIRKQDILAKHIKSINLVERLIAAIKFIIPWINYGFIFYHAQNCLKFKQAYFLAIKTYIF